MAQTNSYSNVTYDRNGRPVSASKSKDTTLQRRDINSEDSITIYYRYFNKPGTYKLDTSINDFSKYFPVRYPYQHLGNLGTATKSLVFNPLQTAGFNAGFHGYDIYNYELNDSKLFTTTRPLTQLAYILGNNAEQIIDVLHTQNRNDRLNFTAQYRFINSPGLFKSQNANHNNLRLALNYQSPNKRYYFTGVYISNKNKSSENGGLQNSKLLDSLSLGNPFELLTRLGPGNLIRRSLFSTSVYTGNTYTHSQLTFRQQYDVGQKDSIVTDSSVIKLFYPRLRLQHMLTMQSNTYQFSDEYADSSNYQKYFGLQLSKKADTVLYKDAFKKIENEFSLISYPDKKNVQQYLKASVALQNFKSYSKDIATQNFHNIWLGGEYKNKTKNGVWDIEAHAKFYLNGFNAGDYEAGLHLYKLLGKNAGSLSLGFENCNKSAPYIFNPQSSYYIKSRTSFNKENLTHLSVVYQNPKYNFSIAGNYYLAGNYIYFDSFFTAKQEATLFNVLHVNANKMFALKKHLNLYTTIDVQQATGNAPVNLPLIIAKARLAFEGNFYTNLFLSTGLEIKYHSNYKTAGYSPFSGQFYYQNDFNVSNRPVIDFFFHFRIKRFKGFVRAENLNTLIPPSGFKEYNFVAEQYPYQNLWLRLGIWWSFIN